MSDAMIQELIRAEKREYARKWREANKERAQEHNRLYWERRAKKRLAEQLTQEQEAKQGA